MSTESRVAATVTFLKPEQAYVGFLEEGDATYGGKLTSPFLQAWLFSVYIVRQLRNTGTHPAGAGIIEAIRTWKPSFGKSDRVPLGTERVQAFPYSPMYLAGLSIGLDEATAKKKYGAPIWLVSDAKSGKKEFAARLEGPGTNPRFYMDINGFGFAAVLGIGIPVHSANSVIILMTYLALSNQQKNGYVDKLIQIANETVKLFENRSFTILNQERLCLDVVLSSRLR